MVEAEQPQSGTFENRYRRFRSARKQRPGALRSRKIKQFSRMIFVKIDRVINNSVFRFLAASANAILQLASQPL
jgi:hypothetical protein